MEFCHLELEVAAVIRRWPPYTVTTIHRVNCTQYMYKYLN